MAQSRIDAFVAGRDPLVFARNVRRAREGLGWTRQQLCGKAQISPQTLTRIESGGGCTLAVERKVAAAVGTVAGRLWEPQYLPRGLVHTPEGDRWYFASHADGERFRRAQHLLSEDEPIRFDPDAIQDSAERQRMAGAHLASGFVRVTTAHLRAGSIISSLLEVYGRIDADLPGGRLAYFHTLRGAVRFHIGEETHDVGEGGVLLTEVAAPTWLEPLVVLAPGELPPLVAYVDVQARLNRPVSEP